jgi:hypothetical protein
MGISIPCPMLPLSIPNCPTCDNPMIGFFRGIKRINPSKVINELIKVAGREIPDCNLCDKVACNPAMDRAWVMWVGSEYTPESFALEAQKWGVSKRIHQFPKELEIGDPVYLGYRTLFHRVENGKDIYDPGIFYIFHVTDKVRIVDEAEAQDEKKIKDLEDQGITPVLEVENPCGGRVAGECEIGGCDECPGEGG